MQAIIEHMGTAERALNVWPSGLVVKTCSIHWQVQQVDLLLCVCMCACVRVASLLVGTNKFHHSVLCSHATNTTRTSAGDSPQSNPTCSLPPSLLILCVCMRAASKQWQVVRAGTKMSHLQHSSSRDLQQCTRPRLVRFLPSLPLSTPLPSLSPHPLPLLLPLPSLNSP